MKNTNFATGTKVEVLFSQSISEHPDVIDLLKTEYSIDGDFLNTTVVRGRGKCDVRILFDCSSNIDASLKTNTSKSFYNQLTRLTVDNFALYFGLSDMEREDLRDLVMEKCRNPNGLLFPLKKQGEFKGIIEPLIGDILERSFSDNPRSEIFVLFNRDEQIMRIWKMEDILDEISHTIDYSKQGGNLIIGECVYFQRKGGNGEYASAIDKMSPEHPGNQVQIKLHIRDFIDLHDQSMLAEYKV